MRLLEIAQNFDTKTLLNFVLYECINDFFIKPKSFIKIQGVDAFTTYNVNGKEVSLTYSIDVPGLPLIHEIGHIIVARDEKLLKTNYGMTDPGFEIPKNKWYDLTNEMKVLAIEYTIVEYYLKNQSDRYDDPLDTLRGLGGYSNYMQYHHLNEHQMDAFCLQEIEKETQHYPMNYIFSEWIRRNNYLKNKLDKNAKF